MTTYLKLSTINHNYQCDYPFSYNIDVAWKKMCNLFQKLFDNVFEKIQIPLGNDNYQIIYNISRFYKKFNLYKIKYNEYNICRLCFGISFLDNQFMEIHLYCGIIFNENNMDNLSINHYVVNKITAMEPLFIFVFTHHNIKKEYISYLNYLKSNCAFSIYFNNNCNIDEEELIYPYLKIEYNDPICQLLLNIYSVDFNLCMFYTEFPKNSRNVKNK